MGHINSVLMALSRCPNPDRLPKDPRAERLLFRRARIGATRWATSPSSGKLDGVTLAGGRAEASRPAGRSTSWRKHSLDFWLTSEDLPDPENRVSLDRDGRIVLAYRPNNEEGHRRLTRRLEESDAAADAAARCTATTAIRGSSPATCSWASAFRWRAWPTRTGPSASAMTRAPRRWTSIAGRTRSTTSMSWTAASSPPAAR